MTRNTIIKKVGDLIDDNKRLRLRLPFIEGQLRVLEQFCNDLCNAPTKRNASLGASTYTLRQAERRLRELTPRMPRYFDDGAFIHAVLNP